MVCASFQAGQLLNVKQNTKEKKSRPKHIGSIDILNKKNNNNK
jgi:hypothetical protein